MGCALLLHLTFSCCAVVGAAGGTVALTVVAPASWPVLAMLFVGKGLCLEKKPKNWRVTLLEWLGGSLELTLLSHKHANNALSTVKHVYSMHIVLCHARPCLSHTAHASSYVAVCKTHGSTLSYRP
jgi:hypothetical protein